MKRMILLLTAAAMLAASPAQADKIDDLLKSRKTMVAAVAILMQSPPNCTVDKKRLDPYDIARFIARHGYNPNDSFMADVKTQMKKNDDFGMTREELEMFCGMGIVYSAKVREANR